MDTANLNINAGATSTEEKSANTEKMKKTAGKAAQFAGAAGTGVAGTMAAQTIHHKDDSVAEATDTVTTIETQSVHETVAEPVTDFNPNDIMIEVDEVHIEEEKISEPAEVAEENISGNLDHEGEPIAELEPVTIENKLEEEVTTDNENLMVDIDIDSILTSENTDYIEDEIDDMIDGMPYEDLTGELDDYSDLDIAEDILA